MHNPLRQYSRDTIYLFVTDWLIITGTFQMALHWRIAHAPAPPLQPSPQIVPEMLFVFVYAAFVTGAFGALNLYKRKVLLNKAWHLSRIAAGTVFCVIFYLLLKALSHSDLFVYSRLMLLAWGALLSAGLTVHRMMVFPVLRKAAARAQLQRRVIIIGTEKAGVEFARKCLKQNSYEMLRPVGFLCDHRPAGEIVLDGLSCLGTPEDIRDVAATCRLEGAVITQTGLSYQQLMDLIERCIRLFGWVDVHTDKSAALHEHLDTDTYFNVPFVRLGEVRRSNPVRAYKRLVDAAGAAAGIVLLSPVLLATALAIKLTSPGPVFYTRERVGKNGRTFRFYKFRSMTVGADRDQTRQKAIGEYIRAETDKPVRKLVNGTCITPVGRFIRKWAIDELPQLFNVLKGEMSMIGPRPALPEEYALYDEWQKKRFEIKPGCTGLWKLYASEQDGTVFAHTVLYDLYYARNINPLLDLYILLMTVRVILTGKADG